MTPKDAFREAESGSISITDDLGFSGLTEAIKNQHAVLIKSGDTPMSFGEIEISRREYAEALQKLVTVLQTPRSDQEKLSYIKENFRFMEWYGGRDWGEILLTSYFEPIIEGSRTPTPKFSQPLYRKPSDLVVVDLKRFSERFKDENALRGRLHDGHVTPYYSRHDIDSENALKGKKLELCWVDPTDAFFLQIQGSGTVRLQSGEELFITYAEKNGLKYEPIGKFLKDRIAPLPVTMQRIERITRAMPPAERAKLFSLNPSYVFFTVSKRRAITSLGIPATPGRTIAADSKYAPKGALALVSFNKPDGARSEDATTGALPTERVSRLVVHQDSGGAITGTDHVDLFWGRGDEAKKVAGVLQDQARIVFLVPKKPN